MLSFYVTENVSEWLKWQRCGFADIYEKYHDDETSPYMEDEMRIVHRMQNPYITHYLIYDGYVVVGGLRMKFLGEYRYKLGILWILPEYRNKHYGSEVLRIMEERYSRVAVSIELDTIAEETRNIHFYEKAGYNRDMASDRSISSSMHLVGYKKFFT